MSPRVAVTVEQFWHRVPGGTARATRGTLEAMIAAGGIDLEGVAARHRASDIASQRLPINVSCFALPRPALYEAWLRLGLFPVERVVGEVDLIWASGMVVPPRTAPIVVTIHDVDFLHHPDRLSARGRQFFPLAWAAAMERADRVVVPSKMVAADVVANGVAQDRVRVVPLGVDTEQPSPAEVARVRRAFDLPARFALWVGTVEPRKNLEGVVAAIAELRDVDLVVVGPDGWQVEGCDVLAPLGNRVRRTGWVTDEDLRAIYAAADVFVFPSLAEGFGLPVLEAMAQGTPVVTSKGTATEEVAGGRAVLVDPLDPSAIAAGVREILQDLELAKELSDRGRRHAELCGWEATGAGYAAVFAELGQESSGE